MNEILLLFLAMLCVAAILIATILIFKSSKAREDAEHEAFIKMLLEKKNEKKED